MRNSSQSLTESSSSPSRSPSSSTTSSSFFMSDNNCTGSSRNIKFIWRRHVKNYRLGDIALRLIAMFSELINRMICEARISQKGVHLRRILWLALRIMQCTNMVQFWYPRLILEITRITQTPLLILITAGGLSFSRYLIENITSYSYHSITGSSSNG